ncbi:glyoxylase-like metal-dependent hydrolase (beta-lactamase superfamily II) [Wenyingzhuangia heitensis]|uniref:Glyoxylase-like metal-dependent hydrolase (Beta-lactamase superfamily II) n=1 Tax=Wenyingzhuangia heitensis TaxID=1487859 RepID=A0ABX0UA11_9FLAO|nr:MBL fold metallo-hydrolase [Wenyingzhuangia heitensis]NIJ45642.1 glyoxylase-like metal-dependent hydrolase (beta-lactamase superfamily II) [Wenyingzhuangia heitensis]
MKYLKLKFLLAVIFTSTLIISCNNDDDNTPKETVVEFETAPASSIITTGVVEVITENTVRYHTIDFGSGPYTVTIVETENNIVIVDLGPAPTFAAELETYIDAINKPGTVIITHNHGDHYGGATNFTDLDFYAQSEVANQLNNTDDFTSLYSKKVNGVNNTQVIGDLTFTFDKVSNAETGENGYFYNEEHKVIFAGDLVYNLAHPYLREYTPKDSENELDNWITGLNELKTNFSGYNHIFVGHNNSRTDIGTVINENITYLQNAKNIINGTKPLTSGGTVTTHQQVIDELQVLYPNYKEGGLLLSLPDAFFPGDTGADWF